MGIDYSAAGIDLCKASCPPDIRFEAVDFLENHMALAFDLVFDKGTLDAMTLNPDISKNGGPDASRIESIVSKYKEALGKILLPKGRFIITSCNWTKDELVKWFHGMPLKTGQSDFLVLLEQVTHASFQFGGSSGHTVTSLIFKVNENSIIN